MPRGVKKNTNDGDNVENLETGQMDMPTITLKNKKSEILEALNAALRREKERLSEGYDPAVEEKKHKVEEAVEETRRNVEQRIFSDELNQKFANLELAITNEEEKLSDLYAIEKELYSLTSVINAKNAFIARLEEEKESESRMLEEKIKQLEDSYVDKRRLLEKEYNEKAHEMEKMRVREMDEYDYKLKREREAERDAWENNKKQRELELALREHELEELLQEAKNEHDKTELLKVRVEQLPTELKSEYDRGRADAIKELEKEHKYAEVILKKDFQSTIDRQADRIKLLEDDLKKVVDEKLVLQEKLDRAYLQIKEMATKTVEFTGGVKILSSDKSEG